MIGDDFCLYVNYSVMFVARMGFVAFFCPPCIYILLSFIGFTPMIGGLTCFFDGGVLFRCVTLFGGFYKARIDDASCAELKPSRYHLLLKYLEEFSRTICTKAFFKALDGCGIWDVIIGSYGAEAHKADSIVELKFHFIIAQIITCL